MYNMKEQELSRRLKELRGMAEPLQKWLKKCYDPHHKIEITIAGVEVLSGIMGQYFKLNETDGINHE